MTKTNIIRRNYRNLSFLSLLVFVAVALFAFLAQRSGKIEDDTSAASLAGFQPGYIISDFQMTDYNSMSEADIQNWLNAKNPCSNTDYDYYLALSRGSSYHWHFENGHFICLSQERFGDRDGEIGFQYGETAAHIIWQAAQDYRINPKVLIVLLQKETGLITDSIPNDWDYRRATGYGCPDTAACSEKYYGFKNQVRNAAYLFRVVMDGNSSYYPIGNNNVRYNPNPDCGSSVVYIQNLATSALYRYTPYQPNAGALAAGYGTAPCGAYGNRNFYLYYQDWFGDINEEGALELPDSSEVLEGEYVIRSALRNDAVIDVVAGSSTDGANVQIYTNNGSGAQKWKITSDNDGAYTIRNVATGKSLDVEAGRIKNGTNVQSYSFNGSCAQKWHFVKNEDGSYSIYSVCSGRVLDVAYGNSNNGSNIQIYRPNGSAAQKWTLISPRTIDDGEYMISLGDSKSEMIDINGGTNNAKNGTNIQVYKKNESDAQKWKVTYGSDGYYTIVNPATGKALDVVGAGNTAGTNVQLYGENGSCAQKWQIVKRDERYGIISACSGLALGVNGANVQINAADKIQEWEFVTILPIEDGNYIIQSALKDDMVVDVFAGYSYNGANVQLYSNNDSDAQKWQITNIEGKYYTIKNVGSGKALDVAAGDVRNGANVQIYAFNGSCAQKWQIDKNEDGTYSLYSMCSGKALDVAFGNSNNGSNIQLYTSNGSAAQKWRMISY